MPPMSVPEKPYEPEAACPPDGVRVVDLSRLVSGNMGLGLDQQAKQAIDGLARDGIIRLGDAP
jgi:hypothetical protein